MRKSLFYLVVLLFFLQQGMAQDFVFKPYGTKDGLSHSLVKCFQEDDNGYLWIGTEYGLNTFDGLYFDTFLPDRTVENALLKADVSGLYKTSDGDLVISYAYGGFSLYRTKAKRLTNMDGDAKTIDAKAAIVQAITEDSEDIWIGTSDGLFKIDKEDHRHVTQVPVTSNKAMGISSSEVNALLLDSSGNLWIGTENGLNLLRKKSGRFEQYYNQQHNDHSLSNNKITAIAQSLDGQIFIGTGFGLNQITKIPKGSDSKKLWFKRTLKFAENRTAAGIQKIKCSANGTVWVGYEKGVAKISKEGICCFLDSDSFLDVTGHNFINTIVEDRWGRVYFINRAAPTSLFVYHPLTDQMKVYDENSPDQIGLKGNQISAVYIDSNDFLWLGTIKDGMLKCDLNAKPFRKLSLGNDGTAPTPGKDIYAIHQTEDGTLWVGTNTGLVRKHPSKANTRLFDKKRTETLTGNIIGSLLEDSEKRLWVGYYDYKVSHLHSQTNRFKHYPYRLNDSTAFPLWSVRDIIQGKDRNLWFTATSGLLALYKPETDGFEKIVPTGFETLFNGFGNALEEGKDGTLYIATNQEGLVAYHPKTGKVQQFLHKENRSSSISSNLVNALHLDTENQLWIGTEGGSLDRFNSKDDTFEHFHLNGPGSYYAINTIEEDDKGFLWLGTNEGLIRFHPKTGAKRVFTFEDGLADDEFNRGASYKAKDGSLFFGGPEGVTHFHPNGIESNPHKPRVILNAISVSGNRTAPTDKNGVLTILPDTLAVKRTLELAHDQNDVTFRFTIIHHAAPEKNVLKYRLVGFENTWKTAFSGQQFVEYTNLNPGDYTFEIIGENGDAEASSENIAFHLHVRPPFWSTLWFRFLLLAGVLALGYLWFKYRTRALRDQKLLLQREVAMRTEQLEAKTETLFQQKEEISQLAADLQQANESRLHFFTNISHELRTPLTLILGPVTTMLKSGALSSNIRNQLSIVQRNANRLLSLTNELLYIRKLESGIVRLQITRCNLPLTIKTISTSFRPLATKNQIAFDISIDASVTFGFIDVEKLHKILNNLLSNAIKYTRPGGTVKLLVSQTRGKLHINVTDTGIGIATENIPKLFDRYYRAQNAASKNPDGAGIGLALTKELVELHKGTIALESCLGKGTTFSVRIPIDQAANTEGEMPVTETKTILNGPTSSYGTNIPTATDITTSKLSQANILLVEDNEDMRNYIASLLTKTYKVMVAADGFQAMEKLKKTNVALVISDVMMPNMTGLQLCEKLKSSMDTCHIPILLLTAKTANTAKLKGLSAGADDYLTKPFHADMLLLKIGNILNTRNKLKQRLRREVLTLPSEIALHEKDAMFLKKAISAVEANISDSTFNVVQFCKAMGMSKPVLNRKLNALTDLVPSKFIRHVRLKRAAVLLKNNQGTIREIMYETGFSNSSYFAKVFKETFGVNPTEYADPTLG